MEKKEIRKKIMTKLNQNLESSQRSLQIENITQQLFASKKWQKAQSIGITISGGFEFPTDKIIWQALKAGKKVAVPKSLPKGILAFHWIDEKSTFVTTKFGVKEPANENFAASAALDLLIVPGVVFKASGYRIGFGGGYYDRFLASYRGDTVSLVLAEQLYEKWVPDAYDQQVKQIILARSSYEK